MSQNHSGKDPYALHSVIDYKDWSNTDNGTDSDALSSTCPVSPSQIALSHTKFRTRP